MTYLPWWLDEEQCEEITRAFSLLVVDREVRPYGHGTRVYAENADRDVKSVPGDWMPQCHWPIFHNDSIRRRERRA